MAGIVIRKNTLMYSKIEISALKAQAELKMLTKFDPESTAATYGPAVLLIKMRLHLAKNADGEWLIIGSDILELNNQRMSWRRIR